MDVGVVGRDVELAQVRAWLDDARHGRGRAVLLGGEAGIGKSALTARVAEDAAELGLRVLVGRTTEADGAPPNWPWLQILDRLGARSLLQAPPGTDPDSERFTRLEAVRDRLVAEPSLVVVEDAHRADPSSLTLLVHVAETVADAPVLLLVTHRSEPVDRTDAFDVAAAAIGRTPGAARVDLRGLDGAAVARLLPDSASTGEIEAVVAVSNGNPLLVIELARHLAVGATLGTVPRSVRDGVAVRLGRRSPLCVDTVRFAAVAGRAFSAGLLATVTDRPALDVLVALDEAVAAAMLEPGDAPGRFCFVHALVRDAVLSTMSASELAERHRALALATETYEPDSDTRTLELARLWDAASALGDTAKAADASARAGAVAERQLAWEDGARLFARSLDLGGADLTPIEEHERAIGAARCLAHSAAQTDATALALRAARAAQRADRADLLAEAVLVLEGRGNPSTELRDAGLAALTALPVHDHRLRARVHAQLANLAFYTDATSMEEHCVGAEREAEAAADPEAELAALRARNMLSYGPEHAALRLDLADRLGVAARAAGRPSVGLWEPLWRIDALVELGRLPDAVATLPELRRAVRAAGSPIARWHQARTEAALALATARFADADTSARLARDLFARLESPFGADAMYLGFNIGVAMHTGFTDELTEAWNALPIDEGPTFIGELPILGSTLVAHHVGDRDRSLHLYQQLPPVAGWRLPPAIRLQLLATRVHAAVALGQPTDLAALHDALLAHRDLHIGSGGGIVSYLGPVPLWLGISAAALGRHDDAVDHLTASSAIAHAIGARGFAVHADVELVDALLARNGVDDRARASSITATARLAAEGLGMAPFVERLGRRARVTVTAPRDPLSPRERQVAGLVAAGRTNREIAQDLYISERTAENHVQHILTKLGLENRTQIATWHVEQTG